MTTNHNRRALARLMRERARAEIGTWIIYEPLEPRDPEQARREDEDIKRRREAFGLH